MNEFLINSKPAPAPKLPNQLKLISTTDYKPIMSTRVSQLTITFKDGSISDFNNNYDLYILPDYIHLQPHQSNESFIYYKDNILGIWFKDC